LFPWRGPKGRGLYGILPGTDRTKGRRGGGEGKEVSGATKKIVMKRY